MTEGRVLWAPEDLLSRHLALRNTCVPYFWQYFGEWAAVVDNHLYDAVHYARLARKAPVLDVVSRTGAARGP